MANIEVAQARAVSGSNERLRALDQRMLAELPGWLRDLTGLIVADVQDGETASAKCCEQVRHLAHKLRGRAAMLQLATLASVAGELERCCGDRPSTATLRRAVAECAAASPPIPAGPG